MFLCSHCAPISPFFRSLTPHRRSSLQRLAQPGRRFLRSRRINLEIDILSMQRKHGVRVRIFSCKDEYQAGSRFVKKRKIVEHVFLLQAKVNLSDFDEKDMLDFVYTSQYHMSGIIAISLGSNFSCSESEYTHAAIIRFRSFEAFELFRCNSKYESMWRSKFQPITKKSLLIYFNVDPVGTELL